RIKEARLAERSQSPARRGIRPRGGRERLSGVRDEAVEMYVVMSERGRAPREALRRGAPSAVSVNAPSRKPPTPSRERPQAASRSAGVFSFPGPPYTPSIELRVYRQRT